MVRNEFSSAKPVVTQRITFIADDGVTNSLKLVLAENSKSNYLVLVVPAMGVPANKYTLLLEHLASSGLSAACFDLRGHGHSSVRASRNQNFGYAAIIEHDIPAALETIREALPNAKIILMGHSLGGQTSALYLAQNKTSSEIKHLILVASCSVYYKNWPAPIAWGLLAFSQLSWGLANIVGYFPGSRLGFGAREARGVMRDWAYNARNGDYQLKDSQHSLMEPFGLSDLSVMSINYHDDTLAPIKATEHLIKKLGTNKIDKYILTAKDIDRVSADHFNWLKSPKTTAKLVGEWLLE